MCISVILLRFHRFLCARAGGPQINVCIVATSGLEPYGNKLDSTSFTLIQRFKKPSVAIGIFLSMKMFLNLYWCAIKSILRGAFQPMHCNYSWLPESGEHSSIHPKLIISVHLHCGLHPEGWEYHQRYLYCHPVHPFYLLYPLEENTSLEVQKSRLKISLFPNAIQLLN